MCRSRFCFLSGLLFACLGTLHAQSPGVLPLAAPATLRATPADRQMRDIPYVVGGDEHQRLDLYLPEAGGAACPLVVWIHGGGWLGGDKASCPAKWLSARGYAVASINYRLSQQAVYPAQIEDCKAAIRFLRAHAAEYGINPERIGVWGGSAGGHLVALLGTTGGLRDFDTGANLDQSSKVQCVVDWFGPSDFIHYGDPPKPALDKPDSVVAKLIGGTVRENEEKARRASPVYFVKKDAAPFLIMHGDQDNVVPLQQSQIFEDALKKSRVECHLTILHGAGHGGPAFMSLPTLEAILQFLDRHLKS
jgi:acetyl esterase/lipase